MYLFATECQFIKQRLSVMIFFLFYMYQFVGLDPHLLYKGKYLPLFYFRPFRSCQQVNLRLGELKKIIITVFI